MTLGAHDVTPTRLFATAWTSGIFVSLFATAFGWWIVGGGANSTNLPQWRPVTAFFHGSTVLGGVLLAGGIVGLLGLALESNTRRWPRYLSLVSCGVCAVWNGIVCAQLWISYHSGYPNAGWWWAMFATVIYVLRFVLLLHSPEPGTAVPHRSRNG